jgi:orotidine-5'-phosphate decarboxylase
VCLGLDPDPAELSSDDAPDADFTDVADRAATAVAERCRRLIEQAGPACVAVKPQLACFERLGAAGWRALADVCAAAKDAELLVVADGKRGDVPVTARAYGQALVGETETPWGAVRGLGADAFTANPLLGDDAIEVMVEAARPVGAGVFLLVRTSNPGAARLQDANITAASSSIQRVGPSGAPSHDLGAASAPRPLHEELAALVAERAEQLVGESGLSGLGAVVGATAPQHFGRLRELMPDSVFLIPGIGAQGGRPDDLGPALAPARPASVLVAAARSIAGADDPAGAAEELRAAVWGLAA